MSLEAAETAKDLKLRRMRSFAALRRLRMTGYLTVVNNSGYWTSDRSIRFATEADLPRICEIERLSFEKQWDYDKFKEALKDEFLVFDEGQVLGFLSACCSTLTNTAVILKIAVHPDHRGRGIATRLITAGVARLKALKMTEVELDVEIVKRGAIQLYERLGFKIRRAITANAEEEEFYEMKLRLNSDCL